MIMTFDQDTESNSDHNHLPALISTASNDQPGGLLPNEEFPDCAASGLQPFSDLPIIFPTETKPVNGYDAAFNAAALTVNTLGVICLLPGYLGKAENDFIWVEINGVRGPTHTVTQEEIDLDQIIVLFMDAGRFIDQASNTVQAFVQRLSGTIDETKLFNFLADREPPVGRDPIVSTPYNDNMSPARFTNPQIEDFGVITDADIGSGVSIQIANYPLNRAEPHVHYRKEDDVIHLSIGGVIIKHTVTSFEASGNNPLTITAYFGTWNQLPNGTHLVEWFVVDKAGNPSPGFSPPRLIELRLGSGVEPLLPMVFVTESDYDPESDQDFINVPDLSGDATIELSIRGLGYSVNDQVTLTVRGLSVDNVSTEITLDYNVLNPNLQRALIPLPLSFLLPLAGGRILITYKRVRPGVPDRHSQGSLYNIFGDPTSQRLPPPEVQGLVNGTLPEDTNPVHIVVPHYLGQNANDRVDLIVVGFPANGRPTYASYTEMAGIGDVQFLLDNDFFGALNGGHFEVHYLINRGVPRPASEMATVSVGEAQDALPAPTTLQAVPPDFRFNPLVHKANLNVRVQPHPLIVAGTQLRLIFIGSAAGGSFTSPWFPVDENWEGAEIPFTVARNIVLNNEGGSAHLYYELKLATPGPNKFSLELPIKIGMPRELLLPSMLPTTPISSTRVELNPIHVIAPQPRTIEIRVVSDNFPRDADIKVNIKSKLGIGNPNIPARPAVPEPGENYTRFELLSDFVAAYLDGEFTLSYQLIESSGTTISGDLTVEVLALPSSLLDLVSIPEASAGVINTAVANNVRIDKWPFFRAGQAVWIQLRSTTNRDLRLAVGVTSAEFNAGRTLDLIPASYLSSLDNNSKVEVIAWVSMDGSGSLETAQYFKVATYVTRKGAGEIIREITVGNGPAKIVISRDGTTACVTNSRTSAISVINLATNAVRTLNYGFAVYRLALHPTDSRLFISAYGSGTYYHIPVLNISSFSFSYPYNFSIAPYAICLNPSGSRLLVSLTSGGGNVALYGFNTVNNQSALNYVGSPNTRAATVDPQGISVFTTGLNTERFIFSSGVRTHTVANGGLAQELAHSPLNASSERLYVSVSALNRLVIYNTANDGLTLVTTLTGLLDPRGIAFHPTLPRAYVAELAGNRVRVIDTTTETIVGTITGFDQPDGVACTPDGQYLLVCNSGNTTVAVVSI
jgi:DNA-binding beta-propeller fold protein YncE